MTVVPFLETSLVRRFVEQRWAAEIVPALTSYIEIPALSPAFDRSWAPNGHLDRAVELIRHWCAARSIPGMTVEVVRLTGRTPTIVVEVPATDPALDNRTVLLYGHCDKQPPMDGWRPGLGAWTPVLDGERLYGRGGADDGYSAFASITAIEAVHRAGGQHARCVILIEASEESGSEDLEAYVDALAPRIGTPELVLCLDSGCATYDRMWVTTSLRGMVVGTLTVSLLKEGVHSGDAGGMVADSFRIARRLLDRVEDSDTGRIRIAEAHCVIPPARVAEARETATELGERFLQRDYPIQEGVRADADSATELLLNRTWRPALAITGADGLPATATAGNVLRASTSLKLALRTAPSANAEEARRLLRVALTADPPKGAHITFEAEASSGWDAPTTVPWLANALTRAGEAGFGAAPRSFGEGGSIPFMGMLGRRFPAAQFVVTGVLGPESNAHGPNEFLHLAMATRLTGALAHLLHDHAIAALT